MKMNNQEYESSKNMSNNHQALSKVNPENFQRGLDLAKKITEQHLSKPHHSNLAPNNNSLSTNSQKNNSIILTINNKSLVKSHSSSITSVELTNQLIENSSLYDQLKQLLKEQKWREANRETAKIMLKIGKREKEGWLRARKGTNSIQDIANFPAKDLRIINDLWFNYSNGKFGFTVQKNIWRQVGCIEHEAIFQDCLCSDDEKAIANAQNCWKTFANRVGWRNKSVWLNENQLVYSLNAPQGHLPIPFIEWHYSGKLYKGIPSKIIWSFSWWLCTGFGTEGDGKMQGGDMWLAFILQKIN